MPDRAAVAGSLLGQWIEDINGGKIGQGAVVASGDRINVGELVLDGLVGGPTVGGDQVSLVLPEGGRGGEFGKVIWNVGRAAMVLVSGEAVGGESVEIAEAEEGGHRCYVTDASEFFPVGTEGVFKFYTPDAAEWLYPESLTSDKTFDKTNDKGIEILDKSVVLFTGGRSPGEILDDDVDAAAMSPVDPGQVVETASTVFAAPAGLFDRRGEKDIPLSRVYDVGHPAPLMGVTFGMGVFATPDEEVAGQSISPLSGTDSLELIQRDEAKTLLERAGVTDADEVKWLEGPEPVEVETDPGVTMFGEDPDPPGLESFIGLVNGDAGPWRVGVHLVRSTVDDHVIVAGAHRWPAGSTVGWSTSFEDFPILSMARARSLLAEAVGRLETR